MNERADERETVYEEGLRLVGSPEVMDDLCNGFVVYAARMGYDLQRTSDGDNYADAATVRSARDYCAGWGGAYGAASVKLGDPPKIDAP